MLDQNDVAILSKTHPPHSVRALHEKIQALETMQRIPHSAMIKNFREASARHQYLQERQVADDLASRGMTPEQPAKGQASVGLREITELHSLTFGNNSTQAVLRNDQNFAVGADDLKAAWASHEAAANSFGKDSASASRSVVAIGKLGLSIAARKAGNDADKLARLAADFHAAGISFAGLPPAKNVNFNPDRKFNANQRAHAEKACADFLDGIAGNVSVLTNNNAVATSAKRYLVQAGKLDGAGNLHL